MNLLTLGAKRPAFQFNVVGLPVRVYAHFLVLAALLGSLAGDLVVVTHNPGREAR